MLIQIGECIFDEEQYELSHGFDKLDSVGKEAFVNHIHFDELDRIELVDAKIAAWVRETKSKWPQQRFRIYRHVESDEVTIRFHLVRKQVPNWCDSGLEIIEVQ